MVLHLDRLHTDPPKEARGMAGPDFASTGSGSPRPRNYIVSQQINVEVAIHYRRRLRDRGIRSGKAKPWTQCLVCSALDWSRIELQHATERLL